MALCAGQWTAEDLEFVRQVYGRLGMVGDFGWQDTLALCEREPHLAYINADVEHKNLYDVDRKAHGGQHA